MLYKFKSKATGDLLMLAPQADRLLRIIGKEPEGQGILRPEQMAAAIRALQAAVAREEPPPASNAGGSADAPDEPFVSLRQRAAPFLDMLRHAEDAGVDVVWGV